MHRLYKIVTALIVVAVAGYLAFAAMADGDDDARKDKILANLILNFPQLEKMNVTMGDIEASDFEGLDMGSFIIPGQQGSREQKFLVSKDDTQLFLVSGEPLDVSKAETEIKAELAKRAEAEAKEAAERQKELQERIAVLPARGNPNAPVTIVEFSDFQCPFCARGTNTMDELLEKYPEDVKLVFMHFPLGFHPWAKPAAIASHCAGQQKADAFWKLHDKYFEEQKAINPQNVLDKSKEYLEGTGIDMAKWSMCAEDKESEAYKQASTWVDEDMALGQKLGVSGTPGFFVNGEFINGAQPITAFEPLIQKAKESGS